jgi:hypothetical protein
MVPDGHNARVYRDVYAFQPLLRHHRKHSVVGISAVLRGVPCLGSLSMASISTADLQGFGLASTISVVLENGINHLMPYDRCPLTGGEHGRECGLCGVAEVVA